MRNGLKILVVFSIIRLLSNKYDSWIYTAQRAGQYNSLPILFSLKNNCSSSHRAAQHDLRRKATEKHTLL